MDVIKNIKSWWPSKPNPVPASPVPPTTPAIKPSLRDYIRAWKVLKDTQFTKIWPALVSVPVILFFMVSGIAAWLFALAGFVLRFLRLGMGG
jgi:hypothetical protein